MAHLNTVRLPVDLEVGAVYGPEFVTEVVAVQSGLEKRNRVRRNAICRGDISFAPKLAENYKDLITFFRAVNGRFNSWCFKDWSDYQVEITEGVVVGLTTKTFQLAKLYRLVTNVEEIRYIQQPIAAGLVLKYDGSTMSSGYSVDTATGIVTTVDAKDAAKFTWSGEFDNAVRFDTDRMATSVTACAVMTWGGIPISEVVL